MRTLEALWTDSALASYGRASNLAIFSPAALELRSPTCWFENTLSIDGTTRGEGRMKAMQRISWWGY